MLGKMEIRTPPGSRPRDGRHCDLCGCSQPAVRCDKCGCQIFCLSCDDMYHRHPKRRFHLRKAVDPTPPVPQARPVLPVKVSHLNASSPGDPSKMPLPPPRKKKSLFGSFRKPSPTSDNSPPLPKKEYSWSNRLGSIKKFMSNRPLPPLPNADDNDLESQPTTNGQSTRGDLSFIHRRSEERPPQLPQRSPRSPDFPGFNQEKENRIPSSPSHLPGQIRNGSLEPDANHTIQNRDFEGNEEEQWNNMVNNQNGVQRFGTLNRQSQQRGFMPPGAPGYPGGMHQSSSATDLHSMQNVEGMPGAAQVHPHFPHYPVNPHMPPHYPYPMYPQYPPNYPQYFGTSFANLSNVPTSEGDFSDHSETPSRHSSKKHAFRKRAKRSQSVLMDRMPYPGQFYPFGPYPGYGPWGAPMPMEAPPSPASSVRSLNRGGGRTRRRKKMTSEDDDEEFSVSSSPLSRPKSSSSDPKDPARAPLATQTTSSEDESDDEKGNRRMKLNTIQRRDSDPLKAMSPSAEAKRITNLKKSSSRQSDSDAADVQTERRPSKDSNTEPTQETGQQRRQPSTPSGPADSWECKHCTFVNPASNRICQVCCKTATPRTETPVTSQSRPASAAAGSRKQSIDSEKGYATPDPPPENEEDSRKKKEKQDMASLNSALDEAEKQISKGLEELMKLKDDIDSNLSREKSSKASEDQTRSESSAGEPSKPVYKSSGRMRTSILDKLNLNKSSQSASVSTSTETTTQTGHPRSSQTPDRIIEARRHSNSSTSDAYNSPVAQSPDRDFREKRDSSCQTQQQDSLAEYLEKKKAAEEAFLGKPVNNFGFGYGDRMDMMTSPVPSMYDRFLGGAGYGGMMQRSHSRASLFTGRMNDLGPMDYGGGFGGYGPSPMYRSVSRGSLTGDYPDGRLSEFNLRKPDFYLSMEELVERRRQENIRAQGLELVRMIREAEQQGFNADDIQVALTHCGKQNPLEWLQENWRNMVDSVVTLSTNYGNDKKENDIGLLSENEARDALRLHKGNIWAAVTECVEGRQRKYLELSARGNFSRTDIVDSLTSSEGDVEMAYAKLSKSTGKPFLMRIWGAGEGAQNQDGARPLPEDFNDLPQRYLKDETLNSDEMSEEIWSEDGDWDDDEDDEYGDGRGDIEDLQTCQEDLQTCQQEMRTPESDKSDYYCDPFPAEDRNASSPSDDIFFVIPEAKPEKKKGFLSKLVALRKNSKEQSDAVANKDELPPEEGFPSKEDSVSQNSASSSEQPKNNGALSALKNTLSAIKGTVTGGTKNDKKLPCTQPEKRTIIVRGQLDHESLDIDSKSEVQLTSIKQLESDNLLSPMPGKEPTDTKKLLPLSKAECERENIDLGAAKSKKALKPEDTGSKTFKDDIKGNKQFQPEQKNASSSAENVTKLDARKQEDTEFKSLKTVVKGSKQLQSDQKVVSESPETEARLGIKKPERTEFSSLKDGAKENKQLQSNQTTVSESVEPETKSESKKPQSLAERLKFAKQTRSSSVDSNSSATQREKYTLEDVTADDAPDSKDNEEKLTSKLETTSKDAEKELKGSKLDNDAASGISETVQFSDNDKKLENAALEKARKGKSPVQGNTNVEIKGDRENTLSHPVSSVQESTSASPLNVSKDIKQVNQSGYSGGEMQLKKEESINSLKPGSDAKPTDELTNTKTDEINLKREISGKGNEKISTNSVASKHLQKTVTAQKDISSSNSFNDSKESNRSLQSETPAVNPAAKPDTFKDFSSSIVQQAVTEINGCSSSNKLTDTVKREEPISANSSAPDTAAIALDRKELEIDKNVLVEASAINESEAAHSLNEMVKNNAEATKISSDIPETTVASKSETADQSTSKLAVNIFSETKIEGNSLSNLSKENDCSQEKLALVIENKSSIESQKSIEAGDNSKIEIAEGNLSSDSVTGSPEINSSKESGNQKDQATASKTNNTTKEIEKDEKSTDGKLEQGQGDKSESKVSESQAIVSLKNLELQQTDLPAATSVQNTSESKTGEPRGENSSTQQESTVNTSGEKILEKPSEVQSPSLTSAEQILPESEKEKIINSEEVNSAESSHPSDEIKVDKDAKSIQSTEIGSHTPSNEIIQKNVDKTTSETSSADKNAPSSTSITEEPKIGKFKFSKSGKVKKTQLKSDKKEEASQFKNKNETIAEAPSSSSSASPLFSVKETPNVLDKKNIKGSSNSSQDDISTNSDISMLLPASSESVKQKTLDEKESKETISDKALPSASEPVALTEKINVTTAEDQPQSSGNEIKPPENDAASDLERMKTGETHSELVPAENSNAPTASKDDVIRTTDDVSTMVEVAQKPPESGETGSNSVSDKEKNIPQEVKLQEPVISKEFPGNKNNLPTEGPSTSSTNIPDSSTSVASSSTNQVSLIEANSYSTATPKYSKQHSETEDTVVTETSASTSTKTSSPASSVLTSRKSSLVRTTSEDNGASQAADSDDNDVLYSDESRPSSVTPPSPVDALRSRFEVLSGGTSIRGPIRPQSPFRRMSLNSRKQVIALEKKRDTTEKPWFHQKIVPEPAKMTLPKRSIKQQMEMERKVRQMVSDRKIRTYRKAEIAVQLMDMNFEEDEAILAATECSTLEKAISYLQQECLLCAGHFPVSQIVSMTHCEHRACRDCIRAYFTVQIRDRTILDLLCPFCNEPDIGDEDVAQDYFNHLDIMLKKLVDVEIHELFQRKLRDRVLMKDPNFRWCSQCSSGFIAMPNLKRLVCPDCNAVTCASCRRLWERDHQGISCEAFAALRDATDPEAQAAGLAKLLTEDGIDCPRCHFRYALAKGGCMHFRCIQCQHDFCSGCSRPFRMGQKCGVSEFCAKLGLHAHHPRNCLFYLRDKEPEELQKLLDMNDVQYNKEPPDSAASSTCQVMEQKETADGMLDDYCGKEVQDGYAGLCRIHYVEYLGQLVNKHKVDPIQIFDNDDLELVLRRANIRLPPKRYRESEVQYREKLVNLIQEELPLDKMDGS